MEFYLVTNSYKKDGQYGQYVEQVVWLMEMPDEVIGSGTHSSYSWFTKQNLQRARIRKRVASYDVWLDGYENDWEMREDVHFAIEMMEKEGLEFHPILSLHKAVGTRQIQSKTKTEAVMQEGRKWLSAINLVKHPRCFRAVRVKRNGHIFSVRCKRCTEYEKMMETGREMGIYA